MPPEQSPQSQCNSNVTQKGSRMTEAHECNPYVWLHCHEQKWTESWAMRLFNRNLFWNNNRGNWFLINYSWRSNPICGRHQRKPRLKFEARIENLTELFKTVKYAVDPANSLWWKASLRKKQREVNGTVELLMPRMCPDEIQWRHHTSAIGHTVSIQTDCL